MTLSRTAIFVRRPLSWGPKQAPLGLRLEEPSLQKDFNVNKERERERGREREEERERERDIVKTWGRL